jgi:lipoprotein-anchoring transpeptidase ErfK/SrfK
MKSRSDSHSTARSGHPGPSVPARGLRGRLLLCLLAACMTCLAAAAGAATASASGHVQASQELAVLLAPHAVYLRADASSPQRTVLPDRRPITGAATTVPVISRSIAAGGSRWLDVMLPGRPNSATGWIAEQGTTTLVTPWAIVVRLHERRVSVYDHGQLARSFRAVVGKPSTPTPTGRFFVEEALRMASSEAGGPFALALSARSNALQEFEGGPGQIAIHGMENLGGTPGMAQSHGCIRLSTSAIDWIAARIGAGIPVTIERG